jgi:hypothetical protein
MSEKCKEHPVIGQKEPGAKSKKINLDLFLSQK